MSADPKEIIKRYKKLKDLRAKWEPTWKSITSVINTDRSFWDEDDSSGKQPTTKVYDTTAGQACETFAHGIQGYAVSPSSKFFKLKMASEGNNRIPYVQDWLEEVENAIYSALNLSPFYSEFDSFAQDAASTGTGYMLIEDEHDGPVEDHNILFSTRHPKECYISENSRGVVDTLFRYYLTAVGGLIQKFGEKNCDVTWQNINKEDPDKLVPVLHAVYPRETKGITATKKPFASCYVDPTTEKLVYEGGFDSFPYLVWRYKKNSGEVYGRGIGSQTLPEILRANQMAKSLITAGELATRPPWNIPLALQGRERLIPDGRNYYDPLSGPISAIQTGGQIPYGWQDLVAQQQAIKERFFVNFFLMLDSMRDSSGRMTATEVRERQAEKAAVLGAMIGKLNADCLSPMIDRVFAILDKDGKIPPAPQELLQKGGSVDIEFLGPLAQAQRRFNQSSGVNAVLSFISDITAIEGAAKQSGSEVMDNFDLDQLAYEGAQASGAPQKTIREQPDIDKIRLGRAQAIQAQQQQAVALQQQDMLAKNAKNLNEPMKEGSMLEKVMGGAK